LTVLDLVDDIRVLSLYGTVLKSLVRCVGLETRLPVQMNAITAMANDGVTIVENSENGNVESRISLFRIFLWCGLRRIYRKLLHVYFSLAYALIKRELKGRVGFHGFYMFPLPGVPWNKRCQFPASGNDRNRGEPLPTTAAPKLDQLESTIERVA
jgi:hypothetical protein